MADQGSEESVNPSARSPKSVEAVGNIAFPYESQAPNSEWCWAACFRMAAAHFGCATPAPQCALAQRWIPGAVNCCLVPGAIPPSCNHALPSNLVVPVTSSLGLSGIAMPACLKVDVDAIVAQGDLVLLLLDCGRAHYVLCIAPVDQNSVAVADPDPTVGCQPIPWASVSTGYGNDGIDGAWHLSRSAR